jgi:hypothetical protein
MRRTFELFLLAILVGGCITALILINGGEEQWRISSGISGADISLRNMTKGRIHYLVKPVNTFEKPNRKVIKPGEIHYFDKGYVLEVTYERMDHEVVHHLTPGTPYNFRYDENNRVQIYQGAHGRGDAVDLAPFVATPMAVVEKMLELAGVEKTDVVYDIGCGDGRIVVMAAKKYGAQ